MPEVGFRITAIRETFEESGLLLASHLQENHLTQEDIMKWRNIVHEDATQVRLEFITKVCIWDGTYEVLYYCRKYKVHFSDIYIWCYICATIFVMVG